ncbi:MAG: chorismate mutase [Ignavibacteriales bacterium]|nr:MAG: chorismate mutase [Ignavibacteriales bacterium]
MIPENKKKLLEHLRNEVDAIDKKIVELLNKRSEKSVSIGNLKIELQMDLYSPERENFIFNNILTPHQQYISGEALQKIYRVIIDESLAVQKKGYKN